jgi:predicted transcriptional regulator of viral defense system
MKTNALTRIDLEAELIGELTRRVQAEYREMPGLSVTLVQAKRLLAVDGPTCAKVFERLTTQGVLRRTKAGRYVRS